MTGRKYQWILTGISEDRLWRYYQQHGSACTEAELLIAMDGYIITDITPVTRSQDRTISGLVSGLTNTRTKFHPINTYIYISLFHERVILVVCFLGASIIKLSGPESEQASSIYLETKRRSCLMDDE